MGSLNLQFCFVAHGISHITLVFSSSSCTSLVGVVVFRIFQEREGKEAPSALNFDMIYFNSSLAASRKSTRRRWDAASFQGGWEVWEETHRNNQNVENQYRLVRLGDLGLVHLGRFQQDMRPQHKFFRWLVATVAWWWHASSLIVFRSGYLDITYNCYCWSLKSCTTWDETKPCKQWDKLPTSTGERAGFLTHQLYPHHFWCCKKCLWLIAYEVPISHQRIPTVCATHTDDGRFYLFQSPPLLN